MKAVGIQSTAFALLIVVVVLVSACGGGGGGNSPGKAGVSTAADSPVERPKLEKSLAALEEINAEQAPLAARGPRYAGTPKLETIEGFMRHAREAPSDALRPLATGTAKVETIEDFMRLVLSQVNGFWAEAFKAAGRRYDDPEYLWVEPGTTANSNCDWVTSQSGASYCPGGGSVHKRDRIYVGVDWMFSDIYEAFGDNATSCRDSHRT